MPLPTPEQGQIRVRVIFSGVSPGTESRCFVGQQAGAPDTGFVPGYQAIGAVEVSRDPAFSPGNLVMIHGTSKAPFPLMWGGHVSHAVVEAGKAYRIDKTLSLETAAFAKLAAIAQHGISMAAIAPEESVTVVGLGMVGFFSALILNTMGRRLTAWDLSPRRVALAKSAGIDAHCSRDVPDLAEAISANAAPDVLIDATGAPGLLNKLMRAGKELPWGVSGSRGLRLVVQGSYPGEISIAYDTAFTREVQLLFPRDSTPADTRTVLDLMQENRLVLPKGAVRVVPPREVQTVYETLAEPEVLSTAFDWRGA
ncbi:MAG: hypothetical protein JJU29_11975 [Verrucomicrobia bacterium]|nr:hypothetical protein [Verrucomicrobiota bacterium]MCH8513091.1 hypothetical protein [Kiritimatiellia bacterium]